MILRRITANFRRQGWPSVVIELVVVVLGVFIGLQASNGNENRQTDAKAADFAQRLHGLGSTRSADVVASSPIGLAAVGKPETAATSVG